MKYWLRCRRLRRQAARGALTLTVQVRGRNVLGPVSVEDLALVARYGEDGEFDLLEGIAGSRGLNVWVAWKEPANG